MAPVLPPAPFLYAVVDAALLGGRRPGPAVAELARGGVRLVQLRAKGLPDARLLELGREVLQAAREGGALLLVNDRADLARILKADGLHVGQEDLPPRDCRAVIPPGTLLGLSTHSLDQIAASEAEPLDYVALGPVFPTRTKARPDPVVGVDLLRQARARTARPLVAIGGITRDNARQVVEAGADGVAVASGLLGEPDLAEAARRFQAALHGAR